MQTLSRTIATCALLALGACAGVPKPALKTTEFMCNDGGFTLRTQGDAAEITLSGMRFALPDSFRQGETIVLSCSILTLTLEGAAAHVAMEGRPYLVQCRPRP